jgi:hypothetical protein
LTRFIDGPACGAVLHLARAPLFLRVVRASEGPWDALDKLDDRPGPDEAITVYRKVSDDGTVHVDYRDDQGRRRGAWYAAATYAVATIQPDPATARDTQAWRGWCLAQQAASREAHRQAQGEPQEPQEPQGGQVTP